ncbi:MAG: tetratricopeptide repeat protein [Acidobacteria bacterium]|nr:tetratricopeptide repeat protein [Acidobacteriota bacterium]
MASHSNPLSSFFDSLRRDPVPAASVFLIILLCFAAYANSLSGEFVWDDQSRIVRNETIRRLANIPHAFGSTLRESVSPEGNSAEAGFSQYYRPIQTLIYIAAYKISGLSPFTFHLFNVGLHALVCALVFVLCLQLGFQRMNAFLAAALFAVHPVHTEAVSWIAGADDLACGFFYLCGLCAFLYHFQTNKRVYLWLSGFCYFLALLSKEVAITLPVAAALLAFGTLLRARPKARDLGVRMLPFIIAVGAYFLLRMNAMGLSLPSVIGPRFTALDSITLAAGVIGRYIRLALIPHPLSAQYAIPLHFSDRIGFTLLYGAVIAVIIVALWFARKPMPNGWIWFAVFLVMLAPVLYFQAGGILFAERYLYMPSLAIVVLMVDTLSQMRLKAGVAVMVMIIGAFFALTVLRNRDWKDEETLYRQTLQVEPASMQFQNSLAFIYLDRGDDQKAKDCFTQAWQFAGDERFIRQVYERYRARLGLGIIAARESRIEDARRLLYEALEYNPKGDGAYATLAAVYINQDRNYAKAVELLRKAIEINPGSEMNWDYLGVALLNQGLADQAVSAFRRALRINPGYELAKQHLQIANQRKVR